MAGRLLSRLAEAAETRPLVWLDHFAYTSRLLARERTWLEVADFLACFRQAQALLGSDVAMLPVERFQAAWLDAHPELVAAMGEKRRIGFPLRTLLAAEDLRALLAEVAAAVHGDFATLPLVLAIPSPARWLVWASARVAGAIAPSGAASGESRSSEVAPGDAGPRDAAPSDDDVETAATYVADFLRAFAGSGVDSLLVQEAPGQGPRSADDMRRYRPIINLADHYRWDVGMESVGTAFVPGPAEGIRFCVTDASGFPGTLCGPALAADFWSGAKAPPPHGAFYFARIPEDALPERVLERLRALRLTR